MKQIFLWLSGVFVTAAVGLLLGRYLTLESEAFTQRLIDRASPEIEIAVERAIQQQIGDLSDQRLEGPQGPMGPEGPRGPVGPAGPAGISPSIEDLISRLPKNGNPTNNKHAVQQEKTVTAKPDAVSRLFEKTAVAGVFDVQLTKCTQDGPLPKCYFQLHTEDSVPVIYVNNSYVSLASGESIGLNHDRVKFAGARKSSAHQVHAGSKLLIEISYAETFEIANITSASLTLGAFNNSYTATISGL